MFFINQNNLFRGILVVLLALGATQASAVNRLDYIDVKVIDEQGNALPSFYQQNTGNAHRSYLQATMGMNYGIRLRNLSGRRVGVVVTVDGRNIISGKKSYLGANEPMYILGPYETTTYKGWRTTQNQVNRFYFTRVDDSYADAWGDRSAMGVIAIAAYQERRPLIRGKEYRTPQPLIENERRGGLSEDADGDASRSPASESGRMESRRSFKSPGKQAGTGFGNETWSPSRRVAFRPNQNVVAKYFLKYEWRETLCRKGIINCYQSQQNRFWPNAYDNPPQDYAPYPPSH
ncbi:MAG: hypothetical protein BMS9Abin26_1263 [Gammaproteobacteria bacterium]|nr:MAG: hypothetical protein BMS9Abin26_1263 [Gammaproteobacteria bacterium]